MATSNSIAFNFNRFVPFNNAISEAVSTQEVTNPVNPPSVLTHSLLMSYIYGAPSKARNLTYTWARFLYWVFFFLNRAFR
jgi:hypothetical protein